MIFVAVARKCHPARRLLCRQCPQAKRPIVWHSLEWLVSPEHPLTARVTVNRLWQELFGRGLVATSENFGVRGELPSHPELLDWLAIEFEQNGWSIKETLRQIVLSETYRQSSQSRPDLTERDPANRLLARQSRLRLSAEIGSRCHAGVEWIAQPHRRWAQRQTTATR